MKARHLRSLRRLAQALSLLAIVYIIWQTRYPLRGFINPLVYFQLDPLVMGVAAIAERALFAGLLVSLVTIAVTLLFGRVFCGWFCPFGAVIDIGGRLLKVFRRKGREGEPGAGPAAKYWLLAGILLFSLAGVQLAWVLDPFSIFVRTFSFSVHPFLNNSVDRGFVAVFEHIGSTAWLENFYYTLKESVLAANNPSFPNTFPIFLLFAGIVGLAAVRRRFWCRYLCPLGAVLALAARFTPLRRKVEACRSGCSRFRVPRTPPTRSTVRCRGTTGRRGSPWMVTPHQKSYSPLGTG
jgi:polyferredoxin